MPSVTGTSILARARTISSQTGQDANAAQIIDSLGGLRALLNNSIRQLYRRYSKEQKFINDSVVKHTVTISGGSGTMPTNAMREFMHTAQITDTNDSRVSFFKYSTDISETFDQLGYAWIVEDTLKYRAPSPDLDSYSGDLYVTVPTFPQFPASMDDVIEFPSETVIDDLALMLASAISGKQDFEVVGAS